MVGSALGAAVTTALYATYGWGGSGVFGAVVGVCGLVVWAVDRRLSARREGLSSTPSPREVEATSGGVTGS